MNERESEESQMETLAAQSCCDRELRIGMEWVLPESISNLLEHDRRARALRRDIFDANVINDSSWPLIQDLFAASLEEKKMRTKELCAISGLAQTTVLRYLDHLEKYNVVRRESDPDDQRVTLVSITEAGRLWMRQYYTRLLRVEQSLVAKGTGTFSVG